MTLDVTPAEMSILLSAVGFEGDRLNALAVKLKSIGNNGFHQAYLRSGACSDLRRKLREVVRGRGGKPRRGIRFGAPTAKRRVA